MLPVGVREQVPPSFGEERVLYIREGELHNQAAKPPLLTQQTINEGLWGLLVRTAEENRGAAILGGHDSEEEFLGQHVRIVQDLQLISIEVSIWGNCPSARNAERASKIDNSSPPA